LNWTASSKLRGMGEVVQASWCSTCPLFDFGEDTQQIFDLGQCLELQKRETVNAVQGHEANAQWEALHAGCDDLGCDDSNNDNKS
jgi:hypothetical protein